MKTSTGVVAAAYAALLILVGTLTDSYPHTRGLL